MGDMSVERPRLLIEEWLPIAEIGEESARERRSMTALPPTYYLHVWWARRPLVASRAAVLASLLPADADRAKFLHMLGIHGDPVAAKVRIAEATQRGVRLGKDAYGYNRAFSHSPDEEDREWFRQEREERGLPAEAVVLDPTAGGGSIPFEATRIGTTVIANDLNPVAWLVLKATAEFPAKYGRALLKRYEELGDDFRKRAVDRLRRFYPAEPGENCVPDGYLWARTVACPYCGGLVPLSPNWRLDSKGTGVKLVPQTGDPERRHCAFEIVAEAENHSPGTVRQGDGLCPYPDCGRVIDGDEVKAQANAGRMGHQLYTVVYKQTVKTGTTKSGKDRFTSIRKFRAPNDRDDVSVQVQKFLDARKPEWLARNIYPTEGFLDCYRRNMRDCIDQYGFNHWTDFFSSRQLIGHCSSVEVFQDMVGEIQERNAGEVPDIDKAAMTYLAIAIDKMVSYNSIQCRWDVGRTALRGKFDRHDFAFQWSYGEMVSTVAGLGYDWAIGQTGKSFKELVELSGSKQNGSLFKNCSENAAVRVSLGSADSLSLNDDSVDCIVMDPPYYNNVTYSELSDFFYVWLKRTAGLLYPDEFTSYLTDKDHEAVANPFRFRGQRHSLGLAGRDYQERMAAIFAECRRVIKPTGVMTVMFTHKASGAWDALATGLVNAGFVITASWPVNTEAEGSLHIKEKSAAKSTIFLVCRPREDQPSDADTVYWEEVEPKVQEAVRKRVPEFQQAGIGGVDLYLASFGPALQVFSENWPLKRGRPVQKPRDLDLLPGEGFDPYAVRPEDALDAARREVKRWRMDQLASVKRKHHLDPLTEWYVLAWDAFRAPRFPVDEALKLARVVGMDFDRQVKNVACEVKSSDVILWDSMARKAKGKLGPMGETCMLDTLQQAASIVREHNTGAAKKALEHNGLIDDATLLTALEALLNVLPAAPSSGKSTKLDAHLAGAASDWEALEKLRRLAFAERVPEPKRQMLLPLGPVGDRGEEGEGDD
jgi:putative DNA methylase